MEIIAEQLAREMATQTVAIDLDGTLRPFTCDWHINDITPHAREFLALLRQFIIVTGNTTQEAWQLISRLKLVFGEAMLDVITPLTIARDYFVRKIAHRLAKRKITPMIYCVADAEDRAFVRDLLALDRANVRFVDDGVPTRVDHVLFASYKWPSREEIHHLCATLTLSGKVTILSATADGAHYTANVRAMTIKVPGMKHIVEDLLTMYPNTKHVPIGKPNISDARITHCKFLIGDSFATDAWQPIARNGTHIIVDSPFRANKPQIMRVKRTNKTGFADYFVSDLGVFLSHRA